MVDTSVLIEYFRKSKKEETRLFQHAASGTKIFVSAITEFEILNGAKASHRAFWEQLRT
jgi:tRNA(fMet)-specific endonuclease VapC